MTAKKISGSIVAMVTPMKPNGDLDTAAFRRLLEWHLADGGGAILVAGTSGESPTLSMRENQQLIALAAECINGRAPLVAGVGANATAEAVELTRQAKKDGADAGLSVVPYYNRPEQEGLFLHFCAVADCSDLPIIVYDVPSRSVATIAADTLRRLAAHDNIIGIKDATGDVSRVRAQRQTLGDDFCLLSGDDKTARQYLLDGGDGVMSVTANIAPANMRRMTNAAMSGDKEESARRDAQMQPYHAAQSLQSNPIPTKFVLAKDGRIENGIRLPLTPLAEKYRDAVWEAAQLARQ